MPINICMCVCVFISILVLRVCLWNLTETNGCPQIAIKSRRQRRPSAHLAFSYKLWKKAISRWKFLLVKPIKFEAYCQYLMENAMSCVSREFAGVFLCFTYSSTKQAPESRLRKMYTSLTHTVINIFMTKTENKWSFIHKLIWIVIYAQASSVYLKPIYHFKYCTKLG